MICANGASSVNNARTRPFNNAYKKCSSLSCSLFHRPGGIFPQTLKATPGSTVIQSQLMIISAIVVVDVEEDQSSDCHRCRGKLSGASEASSKQRGAFKRGNRSIGQTLQGSFSAVSKPNLGEIWLMRLKALAEIYTMHSFAQL